MTTVIGQPIEIDYTNYRGERGKRKIYPLDFYRGSTEHHPEEQYLLLAYDPGKEDFRVFAFNSIHTWTVLYRNPMKAAFSAISAGVADFCD